MGSDDEATVEASGRSRGSGERVGRKVRRGGTWGTVADGDAQDARCGDCNAHRDWGVGHDGFRAGGHGGILG